MRPLGLIGDGWRLAHRNGRRRQLLGVGGRLCCQVEHRRGGWSTWRSSHRDVVSRIKTWPGGTRIGHRDPEDWPAVAGAIPIRLPRVDGRRGAIASYSVYRTLNLRNAPYRRHMIDVGDFLGSCVATSTTSTVEIYLRSDECDV